MLAKLVSGLHKPDDQTVLLPPDASAFVAPLPIRALPGLLSLLSINQSSNLFCTLASSGMLSVNDPVFSTV